MTLSFDEAVAQVTEPGSLFEIGTGEINGISQNVFVHAPPSLRSLFELARLGGDKTFIVYEGEEWTFAQTMEQVDAVGAALVDRYGITKGARVAIAMRNYPEWIFAFAAITSIGAVSVSLNAMWSDDELAYGIEDSGATVLVADAERTARTADTCERLGVALVCARPDATVAGVVASGRADRWDDVVEPGAPLPDVPIEPGDDATILYTSGTTGRPKGAVSTHSAVVHAVMAYGARSQVDALRKTAETAEASTVGDGDGAAAADDAGDIGEALGASVFILIVPLFHVTGCIPVMLGCFVAQRKLVIMYKWDVERALELIERHRVTHFVGVPTQSWDLVQSPRFSEFDTSSLQNVGGGGAPAPPTLVEQVASSVKRGTPIIGYGLTETNSYGPQNNGPDYLSHPTSTGRALPIMQIEVRGPDGRALPPGERGEIWLKGPNLIRGYWNRPDATEDAIDAGGWFRTGDAGRLDDEGFLYIEDRIKDMILRGGENVYSAEVEAAIYEHPAVHEAAVFGVPHERLGEEVGVAIHVNEGASLSAAELTEFLKTRLAAFKIPTHVIFLDDVLPRNAAGKFMKRDLRELVADT